MKAYLPFGLIGGVFVIALGGGFLLFQVKKQRILDAKAAAIELAAKQPLTNKRGADPPHVRGPDSAPVTIEEFGDFQCHPCGDLSAVLEKVAQDYGTQLRVIFRQFPLGTHLHAKDAARASEAAGLQGRFWEMHDLLYHNRFVWPQSRDVRAAFVDLARSLGLDLDRFRKDMESPQVRERITADQLRGKSLGIDRTPTVLINGRELPLAALNPPGLHAAVDEALKAQRPVVEK